MNLSTFEDIASARDLTTFESRLVGFANELDFGLISGVLVHDDEKQVQKLHFGNTPEQWKQNMNSSTRGQRDSVMRRLKTLGVPFTYDQALYVNDGFGDVWEEQAPYGYKTGVAIALHLPKQRHFLIGLDRPEPLPQDSSQMTRLLGDVAMLAVYASEGAANVLGPLLAATLPTLKEREAECLKWRGSGKTAWETAQILSLSENQVNKICRRAAQKLGCVNTSQAAVRAMRAGLLR